MRDSSTTINLIQVSLMRGVDSITNERYITESLVRNLALTTMYFIAVSLMRGVA